MLGCGNCEEQLITGQKCDWADVAGEISHGRTLHTAELATSCVLKTYRNGSLQRVVKTGDFCLKWGEFA